VTALALRSVRIRREPVTVVEDVTFAAARGELVVLMGASGAGKTTILRAIAGLDPIASGSLEVDELRLEAGRPSKSLLRELHRRVGMVFQFHHLFGHMTALANVSLAPVHVLKRPRLEAERQARDLLEVLGVSHRADALPHELSGGEAQRVAIARALAVGAPVLLLDEPTASLDTARRVELAATLRVLADQGRTMIVATHDADFARACGHRVVVLEGGRVVRDGVPSEVLE
jgi:ABC-type polar amino acid transport system ATPase subunit